MSKLKFDYNFFYLLGLEVSLCIYASGFWPLGGIIARIIEQNKRIMG